MSAAAGAHLVALSCLRQRLYRHPHAGRRARRRVEEDGKKISSREEKQAENFRKMILAMGKDVRVILIKLADRVHNMRTLDHMPPEKQILTAQETLDIYAPLSHRLGIAWIKTELEDLSLKYLHPEIYYQLKRNVAKKKTDREKYIEEVISIISKKLEAEGIEAEVSGRPKHFFSIYQKMESQNLLYDQIYDLVAFRILVDTQRECYEALGVVHSQWRPVPGRFKDYIALAETQYVPIAAYQRDRSLRRAYRNSDSHP